MKVSKIYGEHKLFNDIKKYSPNKKYNLLPFTFHRIENSVLVSNICGENALISSLDFNDLVEHNLNPDSHSYKTLKAKNIIFDSIKSNHIELLSLKLRTKIKPLSEFTGLHIFVNTLRCDYSCSYCQVSRQTEDKDSFDMTEEQAEAAIGLVFKSPNPNIKIEFQGGEPLLNFPIIKYVVERSSEINEHFKKNIQFVIATNLSFINDEVIDFCGDYNVYLSTSIDGPADIHNKNRPRPGKNGFELTTKNLKRIQERLGTDRVSALLTTTEGALDRVEEIIDTYIDLGFKNIFLRPLSPYGFAIKTKSFSKYRTSEWFEFYKKGLDYILELNKKGIDVREQYASLITKKLLSPFPTKYVDLMSPAGAGISVVVYNYDGKIYASDEARMLKEMGNDQFCIGTVFDKYEDIFCNDELVDVLESSESHSLPMCRDCGFLEQCGSDPVYHVATQKDPIGHKALSGFCSKNMSIFELITKKIYSNSEDSKILKSWATLR
ncbi:His-Xaa-Ser system radical SAM maturase HxsB [bacterium]|nr:His-Xaa-Ser system radical SAM maturase HxsB [bacterium]|tara:strand:+ start:763 stop:2241 length:1479 start_codon:yes stop_codon:yes gene_type:complete